MSLQILKWLFLKLSWFLLSSLSSFLLIGAREGHPAALYISELKLEILFNQI